MSNMKCKSCKCNIYIHEIIDGLTPGVEHKNKFYCYKCIEAVHFMEDMESDEDDKTPTFIESKKPKSKPTPKANTTKTSTLSCPFCKIIIDTPNHICSNCNKIHPLYLRKTKKRKRK